MARCLEKKEENSDCRRAAIKERGRKEADDLPPRIVFNNAVRPSVFWAPFLHCLAFMTAAVVPPEPSAAAEPVYFSLFSYCLAKIPSSAFLPRELLSAYLTYLDGYSLSSVCPPSVF